MQTTRELAEQIRAHGSAKTLHAYAVRNLRGICAARSRSFVAALKACNAGKSLTDPEDSHLDVLTLLRSPMFVDFALAHAALEAVNADAELGKVMAELDPLLDNIEAASKCERLESAGASDARSRLAAQIAAQELLAVEAALNCPELAEARRKLEAMP